MQVARNVYLSAEKSYTRRFMRLLLTQAGARSQRAIHQIYTEPDIFGRKRAYGFSAAANALTGKPSRCDGAEQCWRACHCFSHNRFLAKRAHCRQLYIIERMRVNGFTLKGIKARVAKAALV
jgi:penicillin-binding protein 1A